jgi:hypothetical protein
VPFLHSIYNIIVGVGLNMVSKHASLVFQSSRRQSPLNDVDDLAEARLRESVSLVGTPNLVQSGF